MLHFNIENEIRPHLRPDERLLWAGKPRGGIVFRRSDITFIPFSLLWGGFAIFWELLVIAFDAPLLFKLWGIPFVLVGLYLIVGRFFVDAKVRAHTFYGLTRDRIIIKSGVFSQSVQSIPVRTLVDVTYSQKADRSGTIILGTAGAGYIIKSNSGSTGTKQMPQLELIENVQNVYDQILELQRQQAWHEQELNRYPQ